MGERVAAQLIAREVSVARAALSSWVSVHVCCGHSGSAQRQTRFNQTSCTAIPKHGVPAACARRRP